MRNPQELRQLKVAGKKRKWVNLSHLLPYLSETLPLMEEVGLCVSVEGFIREDGLSSEWDQTHKLHT